GEKEKPYLQGWALVENPTDEDWAGVKMALISGRPISFKMDLYNPLYVNRPTVEPELFASLRPVTYRGGFGKFGDNGVERRDKELAEPTARSEWEEYSLGARSGAKAKKDVAGKMAGSEARML